jgi:hypothetical protein
VLAEFGLGMRLLLVGRTGARREQALRELLPDPFTFADVQRGQRP